VREDLVAQLRDEQHKGQRRVRSPRPAEPAANIAPAGTGSGQDFEPDQGGDGGPSDAPKKRRRRRRKPGGGEGGPPPGPQE
jgi:poly(A) polymerase